MFYYGKIHKFPIFLLVLFEEQVLKSKFLVVAQDQGVAQANEPSPNWGGSVWPKPFGYW